VSVLALAPLAVRPEWQRRGIGSQLVRAGLERGAALGHRAVILIGHPSYYPRFGFTPARAFGIEPPMPLPDEVFMALPLQPDNLDDVRGTLSYPPAFDEV
jgi:putative acetyltransferase